MREIDNNQIIKKRLLKAQESPFKTYKDFVVGDVAFSKFILYELLIALLGAKAGAPGFYLRRKFYRLLFKKVGKNLIIGRNVVIRHPDKIIIGDNVTIDDNSLIDARGSGPEGLIIEDNVIVNRNCMLQAKSGPIKLGKRTSIGSYSMITSLDGVEFGEAVLTGGRCYFSAGAYHFDIPELPIMDQGPYAKGPIKIRKNSYFGAGAMIVGGIKIGAGAVIGAGAIVVKDVQEGSIVAGNPAKVLRYRNGFVGKK